MSGRHYILLDLTSLFIYYPNFVTFSTGLRASCSDVGRAAKSLSGVVDSLRLLSEAYHHKQNEVRDTNDAYKRSTEGEISTTHFV